MATKRALAWLEGRSHPTAPAPQRGAMPCKVFPPTHKLTKLQIKLIPELGTVLPGSMIVRKRDIIGTYQKMPCSFQVR